MHYFHLCDRVLEVEAFDVGPLAALVDIACRLDTGEACLGEEHYVGESGVKQVLGLLASLEGEEDSNN